MSTSNEGIMLRLIQTLLVVFGATITGSVLAAALAFCFALLVFPSGRDAGGAVVAFLALAIGGAVLGAIVGLVGSIQWVTRSSAEPWKTTTYAGIGVGLAIALAVRGSAIFDGNVLGDLVDWIPGAIMFLATTTFLGGVIGAAVEETCRTKNSNRKGYEVHEDGE